MSGDDTPEKNERPERPSDARPDGRADERPEAPTADGGDGEREGPERAAESAPEEPSASKDKTPGNGTRGDDGSGEDIGSPSEPPEEPEGSPPGAAPGGPRPTPTPPMTGRQRLVRGLWPPRLTRAQLIAAALLFVLGLGLAIQVRSTSESSVLRGARQEDLVRILDELDNRTQRLEAEKTRLEDQKRELETSTDQAEEARKQTRQKEQQLGILAGTVGAQGPGIEVTINDRSGAVEADMLLDAIQELRAAGAEAIQVNDVRVVADSYFADADGGVEIDGRKVTQPYVFKVIGKPEDLEPALNIPGGVVQTLEKEQASVDVERSQKIVVDALRPANRPDYARSSSE
ncbi:DUF881 domain-containing protein [Streptomyces sp. SAJ15]|uniref:DUF881 domain-containing protein n=1 Tax=Streptomyces sp. SAJ15 TaxID=2011095 RepID=UPI001642699E|nr:DUF881 domain-containing protein [Streptomyces sp. SAJ15]